MVWNWQQSDWPAFAYDSASLAPLESRLLHESGLLFGAFAHLDASEQRALTVDLIGDEALMTARIEGEYLDRDSLQSSLLREFGLAEDPRRVAPAEAGMAELMVDLYRHFQAPLTHETLWTWHRMLMAGRRDLRDVGCYRTLEEPVQVVSGAVKCRKLYRHHPHFTRHRDPRPPGPGRQGRARAYWGAQAYPLCLGSRDEPGPALGAGFGRSGRGALGAAIRSWPAPWSKSL
jgi:hypothetical protein